MRLSISVLILLFFSFFTFASNPITYPVNNSKVCKKKLCTIKWNSNFFFSKDNIVQIVLHKKNLNRVRVLANRTSNDGAWEWQVPGNLPTADYRIYIKGFREVTSPAQYSGVFRILNCGINLARNTRGQPQTNKNNPSANVQNPITSPVTSVDICDSFRNSEYKLSITKFTLQVSDPNNRNSQVVGNITVQNRGNRCIRFLKWSMQNKNGKSFGQRRIYPSDYGKSKWLLKGGEKVTIMFSVPGVPILQDNESTIRKKCPDQYEFCKTVFVFVRPDGDLYRSNTMEAVIGWSFEQDEPVD